MVIAQQQETRRIETPQIIDRAYGTAYASEHGSIFLVTPSRYAEGFFHATSPSAKDRLVPQFQQHLREGYENGEYRLSKRKQHLLTCDPAALREEFRQRIFVKNEGSYKLWDEGPAGIDGYIGHTAMTAHVPSRRSGRKAGVLAKWPVYFTSPLFKEGAGINYLGISHSCEDFGYGTVKQAAVICAHVAAAIKRAWDEQADPSIPEHRRRIKFVESSGPVYLPFLIDGLHAMGIVFRKYVLNEGMKELDKAELDNPDNYEPLYLDAIRRGEITFEAIREEKKGIMPKSGRDAEVLKARVRAMESFRRDFLRHALARAGFRKAELYALEFKGTPWETACETYEKDGIAIRPVFNMDFPPLLAVYRLSGERQVFYKPPADHPFAHIGRVQEAVDDRTRRKGTKQVIIPSSNMPELGSVFMHPVFREDSRRLIRENYRGNPEELMRELGLHRLL